VYHFSMAGRMDRRIVLTLVLLVFPAVVSYSQFCSTVTDEAFIARFDAMIEADSRARQFAFDSSTVEIPVTFHIERQNGTPVLSEDELLGALEGTNLWYRRANVRFVVCGSPVYFESDVGPRMNKQTVNVELRRQSSGCGSTIGNWVLINLNCTRTLLNILSHELGHVLGLPHTHGMSNEFPTDELVDGSNCATAGDRICDTPADPNLLGLVDGACVYTGTARDANGMSYAPLTDNIMSYTSSPCADSLTPLQLARIRSVALASSYSCCQVAVPVVSDTLICVGSHAVLHASAASGTFAWYEVPEGGTPVAFGADFTTPLLEMTTVWYVETRDSCVSPRMPVVVRVEPASGVITEGARLVQDIDTTGSSGPVDLHVVGDRLVFRTNTGVWATDGRGNSAYPLLTHTRNGSTTIPSIMPFQDMVLIGLNDLTAGPALWRADPKTGAHSELMRFGARGGFSNFQITDAGAYAVFMLNDGSGGTELWRTDGTTPGTQRIAELEESNPFRPFYFTALNGLVVFSAGDQQHGTELWATDGTREGTGMLADIWQGPNSSSPSEMTVFHGRVYFAAADSAMGLELWETDGTIELCHRITDINPRSGPSQISNLAALSDLLAFSATSWSSNYEPYVCDGTAQGTRQIGEICSSHGSFPSQFVEYNGLIYCAADAGNGEELWALDPAGVLKPRKVRDINPRFSAAISSLIVWNGLMYFSATDDEHGKELWRSDGTEGGTFMLWDIDTLGSSGSSPLGMTPFGGGLYFSAFELTTGWELYALTAREFSACSGESTLLIAHNPIGIVRWYELENSAAPCAVGAQWMTPPLTQSRVYWADLTVGGCTSVRRPITVTVLAPLPLVRDTAVVPGSDLQLRAFAASGIVEWRRDSASAIPLSTGTTVQLTDLQSDTTLWVGSVEGNCRSPRIPVHVFVRTVGVESLPEPVTFRVYPQPVRSVLSLYGPLTGDRTDLVIYDMLGREVLHSTETVDPGGRLQLDVSSLPDGQYLAVSSAPGGLRSVRFIKLH